MLHFTYFSASSTLKPYNVLTIRSALNKGVTFKLGVVQGR